VFFASILWHQLVGHFLIEKLTFSFCFFTIPDQQGSSKIVARFGKCIACPHEGRCGFWAGPTMVDIKVDCCGGEFFTVACGTFSYRGKVSLVQPSETIVSDQYLLGF